MAATGARKKDADADSQSYAPLPFHGPSRGRPFSQSFWVRTLIVFLLTHYDMLPGYTWNMMLKYACVWFELLTDINVVMFVERSVRGGLSQCSNRYARANNKYMSYDFSMTSTYLMYFDVNNLYCWAICEPLPYARFQWVDNASSLNVMSVTENSATFWRSISSIRASSMTPTLISRSVLLAPYFLTSGTINF